MRSMCVMLLLALNIVVWFMTGYAIGLAKGKGWRGAVIEGRCEITCPKPPATKSVRL